MQTVIPTDAAIDRRLASGPANGIHHDRPRVIVVDQPDLLHSLQSRLAKHTDAPPIIGVDSFFAAIAEARLGPILAVIGRAKPLVDILEPTVAAVRHLSPEARLIALHPEHEDSALTRASHAAGFETVPSDADQLIEFLGLRESTALQPVVAPQAAGDPSASPVHPPVPHGEDHELIEALLLHRQGWRQACLQKVRQRPGLPDAKLVDPEEQPPDGVLTAEVSFLGQDFGLLYVPDRGQGLQTSLQDAADWLARWLMLEQRLEQLETLSMRDELTSVWNRRYFNRFLHRILDRARSERQQVTVMVFDIDDFKRYNDQYGHAAGDEILRETARLMQSVVRDHDVVARIGGDEFAVIFWDHGEPRQAGSQHPQNVLNIARRFQQAVCTHQFPKLLSDARGTLTISGGLAAYPWDGQVPDVLLDKADQMALQSKRQGKNAITFGQAALAGCETPRE